MTPSPPVANTMIIGLDADGKVCCCNGAVERITGFSTAELLGGKWFEMLVPDLGYPHPDKSKVEGSACGHFYESFEAPLVTKFGATRQILWHPHDPAPTGQAFARLLIGIDVTERNKIELLIRKLEGRWEQLANSVLITDKNGKIEYVNPKFSLTTGYKEEDVIGKTPRILKSGRIPSKVYEDLWQTLLSGEVWQGEFYNRKKNGEIYWCLETISPIRDSRGEITHFVSVTNNINENGSDGLAARNLALYDPLTNLPGRRLLRDRLQQSVAGLHRYGGILCLLHLNLNRFKQVNDTLGHEAGDRLLLHVANRLTPVLRESDTLARLGGDEFAIVAPRLAHNEDAVILAQRLLDAFRQAFDLDGRELFVTASIGISLAPGDSDNSDILLKNADIALQCAKDAGCNNFCFFSPEMNVSTTERLDLETDLRHALERDQFVLHYQPQIDTASGLVVGVEALIRWNHPVRGLVAPMLFIPLAEATRLILPISEWTLKTACRQMRAWHDAGLSGLRVAVNLSALYFQQPDLVMTIETVLRETQLEPVFLELEITESLLMQQTEMTISTLKALRKIGVLLSIDDFGTGFSSLNYIKRMPVNTLKIDRAFVCDVTTNPEDAALAKAIISMAHSLHLRVVAEGVETAGQSAFFVEHHCDEIQGYFYSKPLPAAQCADFLRLNQQQEVAGRIAEARGLLLVDDEVNIMNSLKRVLRKDGYRILTAESGADALELLSTHQVGVIISDQRMPEMTGVEFLRRVKELYPETIRIVLSGYSDIQSITAAINEGAIYKFLSKPWEDEYIREQVHQAFLNYELKLENSGLKQEIEHSNRQLVEINRELELRVKEKNEDIRNSQTVLQVSQEVLELLPMAVIGVDPDELIVLANRQAETLFPGENAEVLLGCEARRRLPAAVTDLVHASDSPEPRQIRLGDGRALNVIRRNMGEGGSPSQGVLLIMSLARGE